MNNSIPSNRMIITGVSGLLGNNLASYFKDKFKILGLYNDHPVTIRGIQTEFCNITQNDSVEKIIGEFNPSVIIHCASLTNVDECEKNREITREVNVLATGNIVRSIADKNVKLIYISTDSVYDGIRGNFSEADKPNPLNYYGLTKFEGESEVAKKENSLIFRTNIFGWNIQDKKSLGEWILGELKANRQIKGFRDAYFSSIYTMELARVIDIAVQKNLEGLYNCGCANSCTKYEFALKIADCFGLDSTLITPISIDASHFKAKRGKHLSLNVNKLQEAIDYKLPTIDQSIESFYRDSKCGLPEAIKQYPMNTQGHSGFIPYGKQWIDENDIQAVVNVLRSDKITQGPKIKEFEQALADFTGVKYAVAMNSGTSALHVACLAAGVEAGDEAITSPITFVASANCVLYCGGRPVFADIDPKTYNVSPEEINRKITGQTKAIIPVHFAGQSCDMESINKIVKEKESTYNKKIYIIEDACHALGSLYKTSLIGSCKYSDMTIMSFHPVKHITTGEGGVVFTNDETLYNKIKLLRNHGIVHDPKGFIHKDFAFHDSIVNPWYYEQNDLGYNYRITDIQSALGITQLKKVEHFKTKRRNIVETYNRAFMKNKNLTVPFESPENDSSFHLYVLLVDFDNIGISRAEAINILKENGVGSQVHYIPVYKHPYHHQPGFEGNNFPNAETYYKKALSIPLFPLMSDDDVNHVIDAVKNILHNA